MRSKPLTEMRISAILQGIRACCGAVSDIADPWTSISSPNAFDNLQLKKGLVYFDAAEKDLNVNMYHDEAGAFEHIDQNTWMATKKFFRSFAKDGIGPFRGSAAAIRPRRMKTGGEQ